MPRTLSGSEAVGDRFWLAPLVPSSATLALSVIVRAVAGRLPGTLTAKFFVAAVPLAVRFPMVFVHTVPATAPSAQPVQPAELDARLNVVFTGTVCFGRTPVA